MTKHTDEKLPVSPTATFVPAISFTGYPDGETEVRFFAGRESAPVPAEFIELVQTKGLAAASPR